MPFTLTDKSQAVSPEVIVTFRLRVKKILPGYLPCIVGSCKELGSWDPLHGKVMSKSPVNDHDWYIDIAFPRQHVQHRYRFFVCKPLQDGHRKPRQLDQMSVQLSLQPGIIMYKWESQKQGRTINVCDEGSKCEVLARIAQTIAALARLNRIWQDKRDMTPYYKMPLTEFGWVSESMHGLSGEWLINVTEIRLRLIGATSVRFFDQQKNSESIGIKCAPVDCRDTIKNVNMDYSKRCPTAATDAILSRFLSVSSIPISAFRRLIGPLGIAASPQHQSQILFAATEINAFRFYKSSTDKDILQTNSNIINFLIGECVGIHISTTVQEILGLRFEFYLDRYGEHIFFGVAFLLPFERTLSSKIIKTPIFSKDTTCIGELTLDCLIIRPNPKVRMDMQVSYLKPCPSKKFSMAISGIDVPFTHRMLKVLLLRENTIASFKAAARQRVSYIEFSVQLSKDMVPVVYHDFHLLVSSYNKICKTSEIYRASVKDLTVLTLQSAKLKKYSQLVSSMPPGSIEHGDLQPFVTLSKALTSVDPSAGYIIEVKYPQKLNDGENEIDGYFDHNTVVDTIIFTVVENCSKRKIIFSSSNADTCIMLQRKQKTFPVLYKSKAMNANYPQYQDFRTKTFDDALRFAYLEKIHGVNLLAEELAKDRKVTKKAHSIGLDVFVWSWGKDIDREIYGVQADAVISDYINFLPELSRDREVFHLSNVKEEIDFLKCTVMTGLRKISCRIQDDDPAPETQL